MRFVDMLRFTRNAATTTASAAAAAHWKNIDYSGIENIRIVPSRFSA
jgi:hypothetical protein